MTLQEAEGLVSKIKYKDVKFSVGHSKFKNHIDVNVVMNVIERDCKTIVTIAKPWHIPDRFNTSEFLMQVFELVKFLEVHEAQEQFIYDGKRIYDPHRWDMTDDE